LVYAPFKNAFDAVYYLYLTSLLQAGQKFRPALEFLEYIQAVIVQTQAQANIPELFFLHLTGMRPEIFRSESQPSAAFMSPDAKNLGLDGILQGNLTLKTHIRICIQT